MPYLDRTGVRISYDVHGDSGGKLPLLLTHGFGASARMWDPNTAALSAQREVITWDMRGHGRSDSPGDQAEYTHAACLADMAALLDERGAARAILGGLSLGGYLSLGFWLDHPERVAGLLLCDTGPGFRSDDARQRWNDRSVATAARLERDGQLGQARAARGMLTQQDGRVIDALPSVDVPVLVVVGADDTPFLGAADYVTAKVRGAELIVIPDAGHSCNLDQPEIFNARIADWLARQP
ncbi:MAG TPA: alpha/beta fold hydrolase [Streptosporangiaceae bacterium]